MDKIAVPNRHLSPTINIRCNMAKILIIEDNQDIRYNLVDFLEAKGHQTDNTDDGLKALALLTMQQFDIIVLDIMLPGMDGISLCRELRARGNETPVLFLSAKDTVADRIEGLSTGADDYLVKPFEIVELLARVEAVLRRAGKSITEISIGGLTIDTGDSVTLLFDGTIKTGDLFIGASPVDIVFSDKDLASQQITVFEFDYLADNIDVESIFTAHDESGKILGGEFELVREGDAGSLIYNVPEPEAVAALLGIAVLVFALRRRK